MSEFLRKNIDGLIAVSEKRQYSPLLSPTEFLIGAVLRTAGASVLLAEQEHVFRWAEGGLVPRGLCSCGWAVVGWDTEAGARAAWERHVREAKGGAK